MRNTTSWRLMSPSVNNSLTILIIQRQVEAMAVERSVTGIASHALFDLVLYLNFNVSDGEFGAYIRRFLKNVRLEILGREHRCYRLFL